MKEYTLTRLINGEIHFLREHFGEDCYTDDLGDALLLSIEEAKERQLKGDSIVKLVLDEEGDIEGWEPVGEETEK